MIALVLCLITFIAGGGLNLESMTKIEMAITIGSAVLIAALIAFGPARAGKHGLLCVWLLLAFTALGALSVVWSVAPDDSWQDAGRMLAYSAFFGAAVALVRVAPQSWPAVLGGVTLAAAVVCGYALLTKIFPAELDAADIYARLQQPYEYWNAIGLTAAMGIIGALWLGARRTGHGLLNALAYPATGLFVLTLMLAYSRGSLVALAAGLVLWFCVVPLRLRGAAVLLSGGAGAGAVVAWAFSQHSLSSENVPLAQRSGAGEELGVLLVVMLAVLTIVGLAVGFRLARRAPSITARRWVAALLLTVILGGLAVGVSGLAASKRGLTGTISHDFSSLTNPNAPLPPNTAGRLTAIGSVRARYWNEGLEIFKAEPVLGAGAGGYETARLRYRAETLSVKNAHGFIVETLADLGLVGLAVALALLAAWLIAAGRATHPFGRRWQNGSWRAHRFPYSSERIGMLSMLCLVVTFGVHSFVDWTWYVPGDACVALLCAGWLAGRGPILASEVAPAARETIARWPPSGQARRALSLSEIPPARAAIAAAVLIAAALAVWVQWEPQHSVDSSNEALALLSTHPLAARTAAQSAVDSDPLSAEALFTLSEVQRDTGEPQLARATLQSAVRLQPSNPRTWLTLGQYDLQNSNPSAAVGELRAAVFLDPQSIEAQNEFVLALRRNPAPVSRHASARKSARTIRSLGARAGVRRGSARHR
ncbi:MAG TPA: O-antigen ligase family protein [Steroidobacteraceae bacterium]